MRTLTPRACDIGTCGRWELMSIKRRPRKKVGKWIHWNLCREAFAGHLEICICSSMLILSLLY